MVLECPDIRDVGVDSRNLTRGLHDFRSNYGITVATMATAVDLFFDTGRAARHRERPRRPKHQETGSRLHVDALLDSSRPIRRQRGVKSTQTQARAVKGRPGSPVHVLRFSRPYGQAASHGGFLPVGHPMARTALGACATCCASSRRESLALGVPRFDACGRLLPHATVLVNALLDHGATFSLDRAATASISVCCLRVTSGAPFSRSRLRVGPPPGTTRPPSRVRRVYEAAERAL